MFDPFPIHPPLDDQPDLQIKVEPRQKLEIKAARQQEHQLKVWALFTQVLLCHVQWKWKKGEMCDCHRHICKVLQHLLLTKRECWTSSFDGLQLCRWPFLQRAMSLGMSSLNHNLNRNQRYRICIRLFDQLLASSSKQILEVNRVLWFAACQPDSVVLYRWKFLSLGFCICSVMNLFICGLVAYA